MTVTYIHSNSEEWFRSIQKSSSGNGEDKTLQSGWLVKHWAQLPGAGGGYWLQCSSPWEGTQFSSCTTGHTLLQIRAQPHPPSRTNHENKRHPGCKMGGTANCPTEHRHSAVLFHALLNSLSSISSPTWYVGNFFPHLDENGSQADCKEEVESS